MHDWLIAGLAIVALAALAVALREWYARRALEDSLDRRFAAFGDTALVDYAAASDLAMLEGTLRATVRDLNELKDKRGEDLRHRDDLAGMVACQRKDIGSLRDALEVLRVENRKLHKAHDAAFQEFLLSSGMTREVAPAIPEEQILVVKGAVPEHDTFRKLTAAEKESAAKRWARTVTEKSLGGNQPIQKGAAA